MTPEEIEKKWNDIDFRLTELTDIHDKTLELLKKNKLKSAQQKLADRYKQFSIIAPFVGLSILIINWNLFSWQLLVGFAFFFMLAGCMDLYLYKGISGIDINADGVADVARKAGYYKHKHHCFQVILIAMVLPLITMLFCAYDDEYSRWGMIMGLVMGLAVGLSLYLKIMRNYKDLMKSESDE